MAVGRRGGLRGDLAITGVPEILQLLSMAKKSGRLTVARTGEGATIFLVNGRIAHATISTRRERLGDLLVQRGVVARDVVESVSIVARARQMRLGEALLAASAVTAAAIRAAVQQQACEAVYDCSVWTEGQFAFAADVAMDADEAEGAADAMAVEPLLLEGARRVDEWPIIRRAVPSTQSVFAVDDAAVHAKNVSLTPLPTLILSLVDGRRSVQDLMVISGHAEFDVSHVLHMLTAAGVVRLVATPSSGGAIRPVNHVVVGEHRHLGLMLWRAGMFAEADREFRAALVARPGDALSAAGVGLLALRQGALLEASRLLAVAHAGAADIAAAGGVPAVIAHALAVAYERLGEWTAARAVLDEATVLEAAREPSALGGRLRFARARLALRCADVTVAVSIVRDTEAVARPASTGWWHTAALAHAVAGDTAAALMTITDGVTEHPSSARLLTVLAVLLEREGRYTEARMSAERAVTYAPEMPQAWKAVGDAQYALREFEAARDAYRQAMAVPSFVSVDVWLRVATLALMVNDSAQAVQLWHRVLQHEPTNGIARSNLAIAERRQAPD